MDTQILVDSGSVLVSIFQTSEVTAPGTPCLDLTGGGMRVIESAFSLSSVPRKPNSHSENIRSSCHFSGFGVFRCTGFFAV